MSRRLLRSLLNRALRSPQAHLVFADPSGTRLREFGVHKLWKRPPTRYPMRTDGQQAGLDRTLGWEDGFGVTNDVALIEYLRATCGTVPHFPAAGDRPAWFFNPAKVRAGVINAGGPAPGLNVVNDSITKRHHELANRFRGPKRPSKTVVFGYRRGFQGLRDRASPDAAVKKDARRVLVPAHRMVKPGGLNGSDYFVTDDHALEPVTFLKSSRFDLRQDLDAVARAVKAERLDILYVIGGDGSLQGALALKKKLKGYRGPSGHELVVVGGPKTMDNDLLFTDATFGFTTTVDYLVDAIRVFHHTIECQDRLGVMQVFGASSGYVALYAAYCSGEVDYVVLPELVEYEGLHALLGDAADALIDQARFIGLAAALRTIGRTVQEVYQLGLQAVLAQAKQRVKTRLDSKQHALVVVAEGVKGSFQHGGKTQVVMSFADITKEFQQAVPGTKVTTLEPLYLIRDNAPRSYDIALCKFIGKAMVDTALAGYTDCMVSRWCGQEVLVPLRLATCLTNKIDPQDYFYRTMVGRYKLRW